MSTSLPPPPLWFRAARALVRRLPAGRFRAFNLLAARGLAPFEDRLGPDAGRLRYRCDLRHLIARETCLTGRYAPAEGALVAASLPRGGTFVDVGANFGYFTLLGAAAVGPAGRVVALEPDPRMAAELAANLALNALEGVRALQLAAAERSGTAVLGGFSEEGGNWGVSSMLNGGGAAADRYEVPCAPLDDVLDAEGIDGVDLVKMDVEGAEALVLRGMDAGLRHRRYRRVLTELHPWLHGDFAGVFTDMDGTMRAAGYQGWLVGEAPAEARRAHYGSRALPTLLRLAGVPSGSWPHVLWTAPGAEPA